MNNIRKFLCTLSLGLVLILAFTVVVRSDIPVKAEEDNVISFEVEYGQDDARKMYDMINQYRASHGDNEGTSCELVYDYDLEKVAMQRAAEIVLKVDDIRPNGDSYKQALAEYGFNIAPRGALYAESYLFGSDDSMELENAFSTLCSEEKTAQNMLGYFIGVGIGHVKVGKNDFWIQVFSTREKNFEYTEPVNGIRKVTVKVEPGIVNINSVDYVSGSLTVAAGSSTDTPKYVPKATFEGSELDEAIALCPLDFNSNDSYVKAEDGIMTGLKAGNGTITARLLGKEYSYPITVTGGSGIPQPTPEPTKTPEPTPVVTPVPTETPSPEPTKTPVEEEKKKGDVFEVKGIEYKVLSAETVEVIGLKTKKTASVTIPATVKCSDVKYDVIKIAASAFSKNTNIKSVVIGKNIKTIGKKAFYGCSNLSVVKFQGTVVKSIGKSAFSKINNKAYVYTSKSVLKKYKKLLKKAGLSKSVTVSAG